MFKTSLSVAMCGIIGLSTNGFCLDQHCIERHEICPEQYPKTSYSLSYQNVVEQKSSPTIPIKPVIITESNVVLDDDKDGVINEKDNCSNTPNGYKVDSLGCPKSVTLHINFAFASNDIPTSAQNDVDTLITFMNENPASSITIIGHTDNIGKEVRNQPRSVARAKALSDKLIASNIDANRIKISGKGSTQPVATNKTEEGRAQNRRIEVVIK